MLAGRLRALGVGPETLVGLCAARSFDLVVGVLAILEAGGAYVPIDPDYPRERIRFLVDDARAQVVLTQKALAGRLPPTTAHVICLDEPSPIEAARDDRPPVSGNPDSAAYIIYTSGLDRPAQGRGGDPSPTVLRLLRVDPARFRFDESDVWTLFHSFRLRLLGLGAVGRAGPRRPAGHRAARASRSPEASRAGRRREA